MCPHAHLVMSGLPGLEVHEAAVLHLEAAEDGGGAEAALTQLQQEAQRDLGVGSLVLQGLQQLCLILGYLVSWAG